MKTPMLLLLGACLLGFQGVAAAGGDNEPLPAKYAKASDVLGEKVVNAAGESLGNIEDIVLDRQSGRIAYAVLSFGGFLGIGDKLFAVPWQALRDDPVKEIRVLAVDKEKLKSAPGFDKDDWPDMADPRLREEIHRFYGIPLTSAAPGWGAAARSLEAETSPIEDLKREAVELPLKLGKGTTISYRIESSSHGLGRTPEHGKPETTSTAREERGPARGEASILRFEVTEVSGGEATVRVTCAGKEPKSCTIRISENGTVHHEATPGESKGVAENDGRLRLLLTHVVGQGLHGKKLEPGREYTMPGSMRDLTSAGTAPPAAGGKPDPGHAGAESTHRMRFDGVMQKRGVELAVFSVPGSASALQRAAGASSEAGVAGASAEPAAGTRRSVDSGPVLGRATYRLDDGCLQKLVFAGMTVHRLDPAEVLPQD
jgi:sporulation protein YlmC with PRC-barrel domain